MVKFVRTYNVVVRYRIPLPFAVDMSDTQVGYRQWNVDHAQP